MRVSFPDHSRDELIALLRERVQALAALLPLCRVTLFGSWAAGHATAHSDIDLLVVYAGPEQEGAFKVVWRTIDIRGLEPHVYTEEQAAALAPTLARMTSAGVELFGE